MTKRYMISLLLASIASGMLVVPTQAAYERRGQLDDAGERDTVGMGATPKSRRGMFPMSGTQLGDRRRELDYDGVTVREFLNDRGREATPTQRVGAGRGVTWDDELRPREEGNGYEKRGVPSGQFNFKPRCQEPQYGAGLSDSGRVGPMGLNQGGSNTYEANNTDSDEDDTEDDKPHAPTRTLWDSVWDSVQELGKSIGQARKDARECKEQRKEYPAPWVGPYVDGLARFIEKRAKKSNSKWAEKAKEYVEIYVRHRSQTGEYEGDLLLDSSRDKDDDGQPCDYRIYKRDGEGNLCVVPGLRPLYDRLSWKATKAVSGEHTPIKTSIRWDYNKEKKYIVIDENMPGAGDSDGRFLYFAHGHELRFDARINKYVNVINDYSDSKDDIQHVDELAMRDGSPLVHKGGYRDQLLFRRKADPEFETEKVVENGRAREQKYYQYRDRYGRAIYLSESENNDLKTIAELKLRCSSANAARIVAGVLATTVSASLGLVSYGTVKLVQKLYNKVRGTKPEAKTEAIVQESAQSVCNSDQKEGQSPDTLAPQDGTSQSENKSNGLSGNSVSSGAVNSGSNTDTGAREQSESAGAYDRCTPAQKAWIDARIESLRSIQEKRGRVLTEHESTVIRNSVAHKMYGVRTSAAPTNLPAQSATPTNVSATTVAPTHAKARQSASPIGAVGSLASRVHSGQVPVRRYYGPVKSAFNGHRYGVASRQA